MGDCPPKGSTVTSRTTAGAATVLRTSTFATTSDITSARLRDVAWPAVRAGLRYNAMNSYAAVPQFVGPGSAPRWTPMPTITTLRSARRRKARLTNESPKRTVRWRKVAVERRPWAGPVVTPAPALHC
jgi:hypothetical protein